MILDLFLHTPYTWDQFADQEVFFDQNNGRVCEEVFPLKNAYFSMDQYHFYARRIQHLRVEHHCSVEVPGGLERLVVLATVILVSVHILHSNLRNFHHYD